MLHVTSSLLIEQTRFSVIFWGHTQGKTQAENKKNNQKNAEI